MRNRLQLVSRYKDQDSLRLSFNRLAQLTFGIDFEAWYQKGAWDDRYTCYSFADGEEIVANVSVTAMTVLLHGNEVPALQIGTVMTHPDYRGLGLFKTLMEEALAPLGKQDNGLVFLFANESVVNLYPKLGFSRSPFYRYETDVELAKLARSPQLRKLDVFREEDWALLVRLAQRRGPLPAECSVSGSPSIFLWYCLNVFLDALYYAEDRELLLVYEWSEGKFDVLDIVSSRPVLFAEVAECLAARQGEDALLNGPCRVEFHFTPDFADLAGKNIRRREDEEEFFFVKGGASPLMQGCIIPLSART
jgi:ribosomal protein S18 acetylase RimI-like enzyme